MNKKHPRYNRIAGYQIAANLTSEAVANELGVSVRTYRDKINGSRDFTANELRTLTKLLKKSADELLRFD